MEGQIVSIFLLGDLVLFKYFSYRWDKRRKGRVTYTGDVAPHPLKEKLFLSVFAFFSNRRDPSLLRRATRFLFAPQLRQQMPKNHSYLFRSFSCCSF